MGQEASEAVSIRRQLVERSECEWIQRERIVKHALALLSARTSLCSPRCLLFAAWRSAARRRWEQLMDDTTDLEENHYLQRGPLLPRGPRSPPGPSCGAGQTPGDDWTLTEWGSGVHRVHSVRFIQHLVVGTKRCRPQYREHCEAVSHVKGLDAEDTK
jgi:hypothetical protein